MPSEKDVDEIINTILSEKVKELLTDRELEEYKKAEETIKKLQQKTYNNGDINRYKEEVNKYYSKLFKDIKIDITEKDPESILKGIDNKFEISFQHLDGDKNWQQDLPSSFHNLGHGAIRIAIFSLMLCKYLASGVKQEHGDISKKYLVLFEKPELFLHPKLVKTLRELVYQVSNDSPFQVICASHSPQMIDLTKIKTSLIYNNK